MADLSDVLLALRDAIADVLYPAGIPAGPTPAVSPVALAPVRIFVGWPNSEPLDADLRAGIVQVSIFPRAGIARDLGSRFGIDWIADAPPTTMTTAVDPDAATVTFAGTVAASPAISIAAVVIDRAEAHTHVIATADTPTTVAASLTAAIVAGRPADGDHPAVAGRAASSTGPVLTIPGAWHIAARVVASRMERRELRRIEQGVAVSVWAPTAALRDRVARAIDDSIADEGATLILASGELAGITYGGTAYGEEGRAQPLHRRDLLVSVEYTTTRTRAGEPPIAVPAGWIADAPTLDADAPIRVIVHATPDA